MLKIIFNEVIILNENIRFIIIFNKNIRFTGIMLIQIVLIIDVYTTTIIEIYLLDIDLRYLHNINNKLL